MKYRESIIVIHDKYFADAVSNGERIISLGGGMPNNDSFPIEGFTFTLRFDAIVILQVFPHFNSTHTGLDLILISPIILFS